MAHNIERNATTGRDSIVWTGRTPWHRLGTELPEVFTAADALRHGGLDFTVTKAPIFLGNGNPIEGRYAIQRTDTGAVLGLCADAYQPLQNRDAFAFFDGIFGKDKARFEVAGVLGAGERVWLLAKLPGDFRVAGDDVVGKWLLLTNGHDTKEPVRAKFTPIRVVCQNTLTAALGRDGQNEVRVQHTGRVPDKLRIAGELLKSAGVYFNDIQQAFVGFTRRNLTRTTLRRYVLDVIVPDRETDDLGDLSPITRGRIEAIEGLHETGHGHDLPGVRGTLWGAYNAVTEFADHVAMADGARDLSYLVSGAGSRLKERAFTVAVEAITSAS